MYVLDNHLGNLIPRIISYIRSHFLKILFSKGSKILHRSSLSLPTWKYCNNRTFELQSMLTIIFTVLGAVVENTSTNLVYRVIYDTNAEYREDFIVPFAVKRSHWRVILKDIWQWCIKCYWNRRMFTDQFRSHTYQISMGMVHVRREYVIAPILYIWVWPRV